MQHKIQTHRNNIAFICINMVHFNKCILKKKELAVNTLIVFIQMLPLFKVHFVQLFKPSFLNMSRKKKVYAPMYNNHILIPEVNIKTFKNERAQNTPVN